MIDPITGPFDHPLQTPPAPMRSYRCDVCNGTGVVIEVNDPDPCDCECHEGIAAVNGYVQSGELSQATAEILIRGIKTKRGYCEGCRQSHACVICNGTGEI